MVSIHLVTLDHDATCDESFTGSFQQILVGYYAECSRIDREILLSLMLLPDANVGLILFRYLPFESLMAWLMVFFFAHKPELKPVIPQRCEINRNASTQRIQWHI
ncbi:hypothetical protein [Marinicella sp. W31]|uniref:hypothetical protein n=1 Tax=Marinicella sp. W31 TaxID=3023713 RepID=UPI003758339F